MEIEWVKGDELYSGYWWRASGQDREIVLVDGDMIYTIGHEIDFTVADFPKDSKFTPVIDPFQEALDR